MVSCVKLALLKFQQLEVFKNVHIFAYFTIKKSFPTRG